MAYNNNFGDDFDADEPSPVQLHMRAIGRHGGLSTSSLYGRKHMRKLGKAGGIKTLEIKGPDYFKELGRKGGIARAAKRAKENI